MVGVKDILLLAWSDLCEKSNPGRNGDPAARVVAPVIGLSDAARGEPGRRPLRRPAVSA